MNAPLYPQAELLQSFEQLSEQLQDLAVLLRQGDLPVWVPLTRQESELGISPREKAIQLFCDIWYQESGDGRKTRSCHGLIAADPSLIAQCHKVNDAKQRFRKAVQQIRGEAEEKSWLQALNKRDNQLREDLNVKGLGRLHLKQCYRLIPITNQHPHRVGFNWYNSGRSIKKTTVAETVRKLTRAGLDKPHIQLQLQLLNQLQANTPLAQVQQQAPLMRANLRFNESISTEDRNAMNLSLPLVFAWDSSLPFPDYNEPPLTPPVGRSRQVRRDRKIEETAFIPTLRIHRYLK
ncbi:MAG: DNA replication terminus site-binding protein [Motiliproteus sp.]|nr:DNA replication terminus site-binding protein [Motiliproteus sp.]MCW9051794.1 DNA replication terminus site-binding protein [Motiliproteus sp.]